MSTSTIPKADQGDGKPNYLPTPEEIRAAWPDDEKDD